MGGAAAPPAVRKGSAFPAITKPKNLFLPPFWALVRLCRPLRGKALPSRQAAEPKNLQGVRPFPADSTTQVVTIF